MVCLSLGVETWKLYRCAEKDAGGPNGVGYNGSAVKVANVLILVYRFTFQKYSLDAMQPL